MASSFTGDLVGRVLGGRYRLLALIGNGASARVYLADDVKLRRRVAVKVLHASLAADDAFLRRFQREAEALAPLTHPNIVIIHDVNHGENALGEPPYLVTEYLAGGSLRNVLDIGYRLSVSQAVRVGLDAARGLQFAHARGLVHRDIKPANLLFGDDQRVRIADFGLAQALADFGHTEPVGSPIGTTRYLSPEQARGKMLDGRSDVYSLALVLVEAVTGSVPFTADTWQGTAMARLDGALHAPAEMGALGPVLEAAGTLDPAQRLDAAGLVSALEELGRHLPRAERLPLDGSMVLEQAALLDDRDPTQHVTAMANGTAAAAPGTVFDLAQHDESAGATASDAATALANGTPGATVATTARTGGVATSTAAGDAGVSAAGGAIVGAAGVALDKGRRARRSAAKTAAAASAGAPSSTTGSRSGSGSGSRPGDSTGSGKAPRGGWRARLGSTRRRVVALVVAVVVLAVVIGTVIARRVPSTIVPSVEGKTVAAARDQLSPQHLHLVATDKVFSATVAAGDIVSQAPAAGAKVKQRTDIVVKVSKGEQPVAVPSLKGLTFDQARAVLSAANLRVLSPPKLASSDTVAAGSVIDWSPKGDVAPRSTVNVVVSSGPPVVAVPRVVGMAPDDAVAALTAAGLQSTLLQGFSDVTKVGLAAYTSPKSGTSVPTGSMVKIFVSKGPQLVAVPNVINMTPADATAALRTAGLRVASTEGPADLPVLHTRPLRGQKVKPGTSVTLYTTDAVPDLIAGSSTSSTVPGSVSASILPPTTTAPTTTKAPGTSAVTTKKR